MNLHNITLGVVSKDRYEKLLPLLRSVSNFKPFSVLVIDNSENLMSVKDALGEFTELGVALQNLAKLGFNVTYKARSLVTSMFQLRQFLLDECMTKYLWIVDDDVEFIGNPLEAYVNFPVGDFGYVQGSKVDNMNTEGYTDYAVFKDSLVKASGDIPCWYYLYGVRYCEDTCVLDCGNAVLDVARAREVGGFIHPTERNTKDRTGEDILMGARLASAYPCFFLSDSKVLHFPKPKMRFKTKDPKWIWSIIKKECKPEVSKRLREFYSAKFNWSKTRAKG